MRLPTLPYGFMWANFAFWKAFAAVKTTTDRCKCVSITPETVARYKTKFGSLTKRVAMCQRYPRLFISSNSVTHLHRSGDDWTLITAQGEMFNATSTVEHPTQIQSNWSVSKDSLDGRTTWVAIQFVCYENHSKIVGTISLVVIFIALGVIATFCYYGKREQLMREASEFQTQRIRAGHCYLRSVVLCTATDMPVPSATIQDLSHAPPSYSEVFTSSGVVLGEGNATRPTNRAEERRAAEETTEQASPEVAAGVSTVGITIVRGRTNPNNSRSDSPPSYTA